MFSKELLLLGRSVRNDKLLRPRCRVIMFAINSFGVDLVGDIDPRITKSIFLLGEVPRESLTICEQKQFEQ